MADYPLPPSYSSTTQQHSSVIPGATVQDFLPQCVEPPGLLSKAKYEYFPVLMQRANEFLRSNPHLEVKTCESVEFYMDFGGDPRYEKMTFTEYGKIQGYMRGLRLWLVQRTDPSLPPQQIGYYNNTPQIVDSGGWGNPKFEYLDSLLERMNTSLRNQPLAGRILNMETQEMKFANFDPNNFQPDKTYWLERTEQGLLYVYVLRVFYELGTPMNEVLGCIDFVPEQLREGGLLSFPGFENFSTVISRATQWCAQNSTVRFCNAQTIHCKIKRDGTRDTKRMHYFEHGKAFTNYLRFLRVVYTHSLTASDVRPPTLVMTNKLFPPVQLSTGGFSLPKYEGLFATINRMKAWLQATGARVVSAETISYKFYDQSTDYGDAGYDISFTYAGNKRPSFITLIRVFLDGEYREPPLSALPALPTALEEDGCCTVL